MDPIISALTFYPVKGCQGVALTEAFALNEGLAVRLSNGELVSDRQFMVVDSQGQFITQREVPQLATIRIGLVEDGLSLNSVGQQELHIPISSATRRPREVLVWSFSGSGLEVGPIAQAWLSRVLGRPAALVQFDRSRPRTCKELGSAASKTYFADSFGYLVLSQASVSDLEAHMKEHFQDVEFTLPASRFRANILLDGIEAYEEDHIRTICFDDVTLEVVSKCVRCNVPGVDQLTGEVQHEQPTAMLDSYRLDADLGGSTIGVNAIYLNQQNPLGKPQIIKIGQKISIDYAF
jgi:uncharacterized protein